MKTSVVLGLILSFAACAPSAAPTGASSPRGGDPDRLSPNDSPSAGVESPAGNLPAPGVVVVENEDYWKRVEAGEETYDYDLQEQAKAERAADTKLVIEDAATRMPADVSQLVVTEIPDKPVHMVTDNDGTQHEVRLVDGLERAEILRSGIELGESAAAVDYKIIYDSASDATKTQLQKPESIGTITQAHVAQAAAIVKSTLALAAVSEPPANYPKKWEDEIGAGDMTDHGRKLASCGGKYNANGIYKNFDWPLKWATTSVKDQGQRGTCGAFALTSAAESREVVNANRYINASEQDLYFHIRGPWSLNWKAGYDDGTNIGLAVPAMILTGFRFAYEKDWDYNPSRSRTENPLAKSCLNYNGELCTETYHQGKEECSWQFWKCFAPKGVDIASRTSVHATWGQVLGLPVLGFAIDSMKSALAAKKGVMFSFDVVPSFDNQVGGYVKYMGRGEKSRGGHLVHMVGYISNEQLAQRVPAAPPGSGGGYFIIKNSWGECAGDGGYFYAPVDFVKTYGTGATVVSMTR